MSIISTIDISKSYNLRKCIFNSCLFLNNCKIKIYKLSALILDDLELDDRRRIFFSVRTQRTGKELAFVPSECLFVSCERAPRSKQASEPIRGIMDDAVDSLRENDSYGSLA